MRTNTYSEVSIEDYSSDIEISAYKDFTDTEDILGTIDYRTGDIIWKDEVSDSIKYEKNVRKAIDEFFENHLFLSKIDDVKKNLIYALNLHRGDEIEIDVYDQRRTNVFTVLVECREILRKEILFIGIKDTDDFNYFKLSDGLSVIADFILKYINESASEYSRPTMLFINE